MGTPEQKAHRERAAAVDQSIIDALSRGNIKSDTDLQNFLTSIGQDPKGHWYNQYYSEGPASTYGQAWNPGYRYDFNAGEKIPWQSDPGQTWYDPSVASNWQKQDPTEQARLGGYDRWRNSPEGQAAITQFGGNGIAAWYALRAKSQYPNAPDMRWFYGSDNSAVAAGRVGYGQQGGQGPSSINIAPGNTYDVNTGQNQNTYTPYQGRSGPFAPVPGTPQYSTADKYYNYKYDNVNTAVNPSFGAGFTPNKPSQQIAEGRRRSNTMLY